MKKVLLLIFSVFALQSVSSSQIYKYWIYDTSNVSWLYSNQSPMDDTIVNLKKDTVNKGVIIIYWNKEFTKKCYQFERGKNRTNDTLYYWYSNGAIASKMQITGTYKWYFHQWYPDGQDKAERIDKHDTDYTYYYYHSGKLKQLDVTVFANWIYSEQRCENGIITFKDSISSRNKHLWTGYYCNGNKKYELLMDGLYVIGETKRWYENGNFQEIGSYDYKTDGSDTNKKGFTVEQGKWSYYDENGKLLKEVWYKDGVVVKEQKY